MADDDAGLDDVVAWRARRDALRRAGVLRHSPEALDDRLRDSLDVERIATRRARAEQAPPGPPGERDRARLRLTLDPFLEIAAAEATFDLTRAQQEREPAGGFARAIAACVDPGDRARIQREWERAETALAPRRRTRRELLNAAARSVGADSCVALVALTAPVPPAITVAAVERCAIEPLDGAIGAAAAQRRARFRPRLPELPGPSDALLLARLADHRDSMDPRGVTRRLRSVARALDLDPDTRGPALLDPVEAADDAQAFEWLEPKPALWAGTWAGPAGLAGGLEALGRAGRARVLRQTSGATVAAASDPAFAVAAGLLLRRLMLSERFWDWAAIPGAAAARQDVRFEEAARIRLVWAKTALALRAEAGSDGAVHECLGRALGRPPSTDVVAATWDADGRDAALLRGAALAVLVEERLRTRSGHLWFQDDRSPRFLRELWEAEREETAESVADALDLGTMDALLLFDGYRP